MLTGSTGILVLRKCRDFSVLRFGEMDFVAFLLGEIHQSESQGVDCQPTTENQDARTFVTGNQEYIKIGNEATSKIATIVHQKR